MTITQIEEMFNCSIDDLIDIKVKVSNLNDTYYNGVLVGFNEDEYGDFCACVRRGNFIYIVHPSRVRVIK